MTLLDNLRREQIRTAQAVAARLAENLAVPPARECGDDRSPSNPRWRSQSLSKGAAGVAVLHSVRAHSGLSSWARVHAWLTCATDEELSAGPGAGLWYGAPAVAFAMAAAPTGQYQRALQVLDTAITKLVRTRLDAASARMAAALRPSLAEFDLVRGLTGLGVYLLRRDPQGDPVRQVLAYLVRLTEPLPADDHLGVSAPGWWTSDLPSGQADDAFCGGHADLGMAHGIAGPLALLALALRQGITVDGQTAAIERICQWLDVWRHDGVTGPWWPERVTLADLRASRSTHRGPARPSWCYGSPGLARAQQLAGHATRDTTRQQHAEQALAKCLSDPHQLARITDPALCHGWAGVLATVWHAATDALSSDIVALLPRPLDTLLHHTELSDSPTLRQSGLIEGSAGIALILHTMTAGTSCGWETCMLIN